LFTITLPLRLFTNWLAFGALIASVLKKHGLPKFNKEFLQRVMYDENFQMIGYVGVVSMAGGANFILYLPLLLQAYMQLAEVGKARLDKNPNTMILSMLKDYIYKGV
jgi:hypothetical protein